MTMTAVPGAGADDALGGGCTTVLEEDDEEETAMTCVGWTGTLGSCTRMGDGAECGGVVAGAGVIGRMATVEPAGRSTVPGGGVGCTMAARGPEAVLMIAIV